MRVISPRIALLAGVILLFRAGFTVVRGRRAFLEEGLQVEDYELPYVVILQSFIGSVICVVALLLHSGGFQSIHQCDSSTQDWEALHERFNFRMYHTRARYASHLIRNFVGFVKADGREHNTDTTRYASLNTSSSN